MAKKTKDIRINEEFERMIVFFEDLQEDRREIVKPMIQNAAFMRVTLEDLQEIIIHDGPTETYQNGANQHGVKQSATLQSYNTLIKNYAAVIKTLAQYLPQQSRVAFNTPCVRKDNEDMEDPAEREARLESDYEEFMERLKSVNQAIS